MTGNGQSESKMTPRSQKGGGEAVDLSMDRLELFLPGFGPTRSKSDLSSSHLRRLVSIQFLIQCSFGAMEDDLTEEKQVEGEEERTEH